DLVELEQADAERAAPLGIVRLPLHEALEAASRRARAAGLEILEPALERFERRAIGGGGGGLAVERVESLHGVLGETTARREELDDRRRLLATVAPQHTHDHTSLSPEIVSHTETRSTLDTR